MWSSTVRGINTKSSQWTVKIQSSNWKKTTNNPATVRHCKKKIQKKYTILKTDVLLTWYIVNPWGRCVFICSSVEWNYICLSRKSILYYFDRNSKILWLKWLFCEVKNPESTHLIHVNKTTRENTLQDYQILFRTQWIISST